MRVSSYNLRLPYSYSGWIICVTWLLSGSGSGAAQGEAGATRGTGHKVGCIDRLPKVATCTVAPQSIWWCPKECTGEAHDTVGGACHRCVLCTSCYQSRALAPGTLLLVHPGICANEGVWRMCVVRGTTGRRFVCCAGGASVPGTERTDDVPTCRSIPFYACARFWDGSSNQHGSRSALFH